MSAYRVLVVDDDVFFLKLYSSFLRSHGFEVDTVASGDEALRSYDPERYELLIVDLIMPGMNGLELIERVRSINPAQDVIVVTGSDDVRAAVRAMRLGVYEYLVKPIEREELILVIDRLQERSTLYDEHARLLHENIQHAEHEQLFARGLKVMQSLDLETVCESTLESLSEICGAQGAALWLARDDGTELTMQGYRGLLEAGVLPMAWNPMQTALAPELGAGLPVLAKRDLLIATRQQEPAEILICPLAREGRLIGIIALFDKLGGGFTTQDAAHAKLIADCAVIAVHHARRFRHLERIGLRDTSTAAYNMTYFVDYLGRELHKARRYRRSFSLVQITIDNVDTLQKTLPAEVYKEASRQIVVAISSVLRDIDVLARLSASELYLLSPETDFLGGLAFARAAREAIGKSTLLAAIDREHPINVSFGPAAFPRDGDDVDQLFTACRRRIDEARRSLFRRLHLEDVDFWSAAELLIGDDENYRPDKLDSARPFSVTEDDKGLSRHDIFPPGFANVVRGEVLVEAARQARSSGWLFFGGSWQWASDDFVRQLRPLEASALRTYYLSNEPPAVLADMPHVTTVRAQGERFSKHDVVLLLAEHAAYGFLARRRGDGRLYGLHTADWTLVEGLIDKLQDAYHLQKGGET